MLAAEFCVSAGQFTTLVQTKICQPLLDGFKIQNSKTLSSINASWTLLTGVRARLVAPPSFQVQSKLTYTSRLQSKCWPVALKHRVLSAGSAHWVHRVSLSWAELLSHADAMGDSVNDCLKQHFRSWGIWTAAMRHMKWRPSSWAGGACTPCTEALSSLQALHLADKRPNQDTTLKVDGEILIWGWKTLLKIVLLFFINIEPSRFPQQKTSMLGLFILQPPNALRKNKVWFISVPRCGHFVQTFMLLRGWILLMMVLCLFLSHHHY